MVAGRIGYNTDVSSQVQGDVNSLAAQLESLISQRQSQVNAAMSDFQADGTSEDYQVVEQRWNRAANETRTIISLVKQTLSKNDQTAVNANNAAKAAVHNIG